MLRNLSVASLKIIRYLFTIEIIIPNAIPTE